MDSITGMNINMIYLPHPHRPSTGCKRCQECNLSSLCWLLAVLKIFLLLTLLPPGGQVQLHAEAGQHHEAVAAQQWQAEAGQHLMDSLPQWEQV